MTTGYEVGMYRDIHHIATALNRIANCLEAAELRARASTQAPVHAGTEYGVHEESGEGK